MADIWAAFVSRVIEDVRVAPMPMLVATSTMLLGLVAVAVEVWWLAAREPARGRDLFQRTGTGLAMAAGAIVVGFGYTAVLRRLWPLFHRLGPASLPHLWAGHRAVSYVVAFVAWDAIGWLYHAIGHHSAVGWAAHRPHHTGVDFDLTLGLRESWTPFHGLLVQPVVAVAGFPLSTIVACSAISNLLQLLQHTSARVQAPRLVAAVIMTPDAHRQHHRSDANGLRNAVNLGPVFTVWDRLAGTWVAPSPSGNFAYGTAGQVTSNPLRLEFDGWIALSDRVMMARRT